jgi:protein gp37
MAKSTILWTDATWNPVTGCNKISPGCKNCYAAKMAKRLKAMGQPNYRNGFELTCHPHMLDLPLHWRKARKVFVNSMSDLFHRDVPEGYIRQVFEVMVRAPQHQFQVLTKRSQRLLELAPSLPWPANVWAGVSVESEQYLNRVDELRQVPAAVRFLSCEPLLGPLPGLDLEGIDWVIVGGESGSGFRAMEPEWAMEIQKQCEAASVPFLFKQFSGVRPKLLGRKLDGDEYDAYPMDNVENGRCHAA